MCECFIHIAYGAGKLYLVLCVTGQLHFSLFLHYSFSLFPKRQILDSFKFKEFADDNFKYNKNGRKFSKQVENTVGKEEIACYEQFLLFPQCFQKACFPGVSEGVIVWEWVNSLWNDKILDWTSCWYNYFSLL